jgi:hypothetical protein
MMTGEFKEAFRANGIVSSKATEQQEPLGRQTYPRLLGHLHTKPHIIRLQLSAIQWTEIYTEDHHDYTETSITRLGTFNDAAH